MNHRDIKLDHKREERIGFDEAVFAASKSIEQLSAIISHSQHSAGRLLITRLSEEQYRALPQTHQASVDYDPTSRTAILGRAELRYELPKIAVLTAGTSDVPVSREATRTLHYYGHPCEEISDVGVAGLWRLLERVNNLQDKSAVIVAAGMDGALPSVVAGLVPGLVIAVPTSVGYGVADQGRTALNAALASCAPGLVVVNINNGYGAACAAMRALRTSIESGIGNPTIRSSA